ncbi:hypothetical protein MANI_026556 [Metarhizium anisopliae]|nr:hypothetical protein MANI_026556 [Metarhizium anisopliae]
MVTLAKIPPQWILPEAVLEEAAAMRNITGPFIRKLLNEEEVTITEAPTAQLVGNIRTRQYSAEEVAAAYCKRAAFAHQLIFFQDAIQQVVNLDRQLKETGEFAGPMHGVPVSLKDQFHVKYAAETTMGYVSWVGTFEGAQGTGRGFHDQSQLVEELHSLGAVLYCKTSCPQTLLLGETVNNLIGRTKNPVNQLLSCGGESGGESALLALGASNVGVGTDIGKHIPAKIPPSWAFKNASDYCWRGIGGSARIPAAFCGTCSIKPSCGRFSYRTVANSHLPICNRFHVDVIAGVEAHNDISAFNRALVTRPIRRAYALARRKGVYPGKLCFAVLRNDRMVQPHPPIARGIEIVVDAVKHSGDTVIEWEPPSHEEALALNVSERFGNGPKDPVPTLELLDIVLKHKAYVARYLEYWASTDKHTGTGRAVDAVILPVAPHAAVIPGEYFSLRAVLPVTKADKNVDVAHGDFKPLTPNDEVNWRAYNADTYDGAPVCVQLMGRKFEEERILGIAMRVEERLRKLTK